jgi:hypothetical protein
MISLELVFVIGILGFLVQKIVVLVYAWVNKFYYLQSILIIVTSYLQIPSEIETVIKQVKISTIEKDKTLTISCKEKNTLKTIENFLKTNIPNDDSSFTVTNRGDYLEITVNKEK